MLSRCADILLGSRIGDFDAEHPRWDRWHGLAAGVFGIGLGLPITPLEYAGLPVASIALLRLPQTWRRYRSLFSCPAMLMTLAWIAWAFVALAWSSDRPHGLDELASLRWMWIPVALFPVLHHARTVVIGVSFGFVLMHGSQLAQLLDQRLDLGLVGFVHLHNRVSGWSMPAVAGTLLCGVFAMHLAPAALGTGRTAWIARALAACAFAGVIATGTRGAWIVACALLLCVGTIAAARGVRSRASRSRAIVALLAVLLIGIAIGAVLGDKIRSRVDEAQREIARAVETGDYSTSTGGRIIMWSWGVRAMAEHPVAGVGTGAYRAWVREQQIGDGIDPGSQRVLDHAHNMYLHSGATQGGVGLLLMLGAAAAALASAWPGRDRLGTYDAGVYLGLLALLMMGVFDAVHINAQSSALLLAMGTLGLRHRSRRA